MIRFEAKYENHNDGSIGSFIDNADAILSNKMASQLNSRNIEKACIDHPDFESIIAISMQPNIQFEIKSVCCETFRNELEKFLDTSKESE